MLQAGGHRELCTTEGGHTRPLSLMGNNTTMRKHSYQACKLGTDPPVMCPGGKLCQETVGTLPQKPFVWLHQSAWTCTLDTTQKCAISVLITLMASVYTVYAYRKLKFYYFRRIWTVHHPFRHKPHTKQLTDHQRV